MSSWRSSAGRSETGAARRRSRSRSRSREREQKWGRPEEQAAAAASAVQKEAPNYERSGLLAAEANMLNGVVLKVAEPAEAKAPATRWRLYVFDGSGPNPVEILHVSQKSCFRIGSERAVCEIVTDAASTAGQQAVLQFRQVNLTADGVRKRVVRPYVMDLESEHGTRLNGERIEPACYVELRAGDMLQFGASERQYVLLHDQADASVVAADETVATDGSSRQRRRRRHREARSGSRSRS